MYSNKIFEIFKNPTCAGGLQGSNGIGKYIDDNCGDFVKMYLKIDDNQTIIEARFKTMGSVGTIVASSVLCQQITDLTITQAQQITGEDILSITGEYPQDKKYSLDFAIRALNLAIADYFQRLEKEPKRKKADKEKLSAETTIQTTAQETEKSMAEQGIVGEEVKKLVSKEQGDTSDVQDDDLMDYYDDLLFYDDAFESSKTEDKPTTFVDAPNSLDPVDVFLKGDDNKSLEVQTLTNRETLAISKTEEEPEFEIDEKAQKMVNDARSYTPFVETKIIRGKDIKKETVKKQEQEADGKRVSKAKAMFDSMFE